MLKKVLCISAALALAVSLTACSTYLEKSGTYDVETGDRVKITVDAKAGYDITLEAPFVISKDDETILNGTFLYSEYLEEYKSAYEAEPTASLVDEGEKDGNEYFCYAVGDEYDYFVKVGDSNSDNHIAAWTNKVGTGLPPPVRWQKMARVTVGGTVCISRSRAVVARLVHTQEAAGSSPASATSPLWGILSPSLHGGLVFAPAFNLPTRPPLLGDIAQLAERWLCKP